MVKYFDIEKLDEVLKLNNKIITGEKLDEITELDICTHYENNGYSGRFAEKLWYSIILYSPLADFEQEEISVYI